MARKRHSDEDILKLLREIELNLSSDHIKPSACVHQRPKPFRETLRRWPRQRGLYSVARSENDR